MANASLTDAYEHNYDDTSDDDVIPLSPEGMTLSAIVLIALIVVGIGGNALTIASFVRDKQLRKVYDCFILNLAIADLFICTSSMPFYVVYTLSELTWPFGVVFCKLWLVIDFTCCFESILMMIILSADRLLLIIKGARYFQTLTLKRVRIVMGMSWFISFLLYGPAIIGWDLWGDYSIVEPRDCDVEFAQDQYYTSATAIAEVILPCICVTSINAIIVYKIRQKRPVPPTMKNDSATCSTISKMNDNLTASIDSVDTLKPSKAQGMRSHELKAGSLLTILVVAFLVCWMPYTITTVMISFCDNCVNTVLHEVFTWLLWVKSVLNPILYAYKSKRYRENFCKMLSCGRRAVMCGPVSSVTMTDSGTTPVASNPCSSETTTGSRAM